jgi:glycosyltransferase involved in cell wall biosynthesis
MLPCVRPRPRIGLLASVGITHDLFFPEIVSHLRALGYPVCLAAGTPTLRIDSSTIPGLTRKPSLENWRARAALRQWVRDNNISVIVTSTATVSALARFFVRDCPVVYFCHGLHWAGNSGPEELLWKAVETLALRGTAGVITLNREDEHWFNIHAPGLKAMRLPFGVGIDPIKYPRTLPSRSKELRLCWIGEFSVRKNPSHAIHLAAALRRKGIGLHLDMLGEGALYDSSKALVEQLGLKEYVTLRGFVPTTSFLMNSDALVHTARWEGLPRVILESLAVGRPIFSYDIKGTRCIPCVYRTPYGNIEAMAHGISNFDWNSVNGFDDFPQSDALSYKVAAEHIVGFVEGITSS